MSMITFAQKYVSNLAALHNKDLEASFLNDTFFERYRKNVSINYSLHSNPRTLIVPYIPNPPRNPSGLLKTQENDVTLQSPLKAISMVDCTSSSFYVVRWRLCV